MDYGKAFTFAFEDKDWIRKLGVAALIYLAATIALIIPANLFVYGYGIAVARNVADGVKNPLPEFDNVGEMFIDGLKFLVIMLVYSLPMLILVCILFGIIGMAGGFAENGGDISALGGIGISVIACIMIFYGLFLAFATPAIMLAYLRDGEIGTALKFGEIWAFTQNHLGELFMLLVMTIALSLVFQVVFVLSALTICGPLILLFVGPVWLSAGNGHLVGQLKNSVDGAPPAEKAIDPDTVIS